MKDMRIHPIFLNTLGEPSMKFVNKEFLNDSVNETGFIIVKGKSDRQEDLSEHSAENLYMEAEVQISDCSKKIYLDFSVTKDSDLVKRLAKLDVLINNLVELRTHLPVLWADTQLQAAIWLDNNKEELEEDE
jgi:hypothetical protein